MKSFSAAGFLAHTAALAHETEKMQHHLLEVACKAVAAEAKGEIGHYQPASGPFAAWPALASTTIDRKGGTDDPLLREGAMRDSITYSVNVPTGTVGSDDPAAVYQELGTRHMPPRSVLGGSAHKLAPAIAVMVGTQYTQFLAGQSVYNLRADVVGKMAGTSAWSEFQSILKEGDEGGLTAEMHGRAISALNRSMEQALGDEPDESWKQGMYPGL